MNCVTLEVGTKKRETTAVKQWGYISKINEIPYYGRIQI